MKNILITGCSSGIGRHLAFGLRDLGYDVYATARKEDDVLSLEAEGFRAYKLDLNSSQSINEAFLWVISKAQKIDILINNGAFGQPGAVEDLSTQALKMQFETNLFGTHELTRLAIEDMRKHQCGKIIQISSVLGFVAMKYRGAYVASKFALEGLSDAMRLELYGSGIFVSLVEPGPIKSKFRENALQKFLENIDYKNSCHAKIYEKTLQRLQGEKETPFTLEPQAVLDAVVEIIKSKNPKPRYRVTFPTTIFWFLKRVLSSKINDFILKKVE